MILVDNYSIVALVYLIPIILILLALSLFLILFIRDKRYQKFVLAHSESIKRINEINKTYQFIDIPNMDMSHSYDNEKFYNNISPRDYLTYQLVFKHRAASKAIKDANSNKKLFDEYKEVVLSSCTLNRFDTDQLLRSTKKLEKVEKKLFDKAKLRPRTKFTIDVKLKLTNINGDFKKSKRDVFQAEDILDIIERLKNKRNDFYLDEEIWNSICRVERGKVTNKMRFAIYQRDGYRCRICGNDLEIDHIYPIAKGGKTTMDNLQTLCHRCNVRKGDSVID